MTRREEKPTYKYAPLIAAGITMAAVLAKNVAQRYTIERRWRLELKDLGAAALAAGFGYATFRWSHGDDMEGVLTMTG